MIYIPMSIPIPMEVLMHVMRGNNLFVLPFPVECVQLALRKHHREQVRPDRDETAHYNGER